MQYSDFGLCYVKTFDSFTVCPTKMTCHIESEGLRLLVHFLIMYNMNYVIINFLNLFFYMYGILVDFI